MRLLSKMQVIVRIMAVITLVEFTIMMAFYYVPHQGSGLAEAVIDIGVLALVAAPLVYRWVVAPFVEQRDRALHQWSLLAYTDPLTHLANRRRLIDSLQRVISSGRRHRVWGALLLIDLDGFKQINDVHGHEAGDAVLIEIGDRLRTITRTEDLAARLGGDEFVLLIDRVDTDAQHVREKVQRITSKLLVVVNRPVEFRGLTLTVGASIGVRVLDDAGLDPEMAIAQADAALYDVKRSGRGRTTFFGPDTAKISDLMTL